MRILFFIVLLLCAIPVSNVNSASLDMGVIDYAGTGALNADIDAFDGSISCNNSSTYTCPAFGTPGSVLITGSVGGQVSVACRKTPKLSNQNSVVLTLRNSHIVLNGNKYGCNGLKNALVTHTITGNAATDTVYWGGQLRVSNADSNDLSGSFSTNGPGGSKSQRVRLSFL